MSTTDPLDLDAIEARANGASDGPWEIIGGNEYLTGVDMGVGSPEGIRIQDAHFIAHARADVPALVARVRELTPRVLEGDWETVGDALDALPLGTVIKWSDDLGYSAAIKCPNVMGDARWFEAGVRNPRSSESIAGDETPIEVIA